MSRPHNPDYDTTVCIYINPCPFEGDLSQQQMAVWLYACIYVDLCAEPYSLLSFSFRVMLMTPVIESTVEISVLAAGKPCKTWYKIYGTLTSSTRPLICLNGGPGCPYFYLEPLGTLAEEGSFPVIFYASSTHLPKKAGVEEFWTSQLFLDELDNLIAKLGIRKYDLLGQSWGGMLGAMHAVQQPKGLRRLILANSLADTQSELPEDMQKELLKYEKDGLMESEGYHNAMQVFWDRHFCVVKPLPEPLLKSMIALAEDNTVRRTMWGSSNFVLNGTLKNFSILNDLHKIIVPTLLINGKYDVNQDEVMEHFFNAIEKVKWRTLDGSAHMTHLDEPKLFLNVVGNFLLA